MIRVTGQKWWALGTLSLAVVAVGLDGTVLSVALPTLAGALRASESDLQWFSSGYLLALAAAMLPAGLLGDRYGRRKVMLTALALFGAASAACAFCSTPAEFIAARCVLGAAGAGVIVMALSTLTVLFTERERPKAVGVWAAANFLALPVGPILGGWLLTHYWWGWVFLINVPVVLLGLIALALLVPESRAPQRPALDLVGVLASTLGLVILTFGMVEAGRHGWGQIGAWGWMLLGVAVLILFFSYERRLSLRPGGEPLIDPALFDSASYIWGVILVAVAVLAMLGVLFTMPQYFQGVLGTDAMGSGTRLLPLIGGLIIGVAPADLVVQRVGAKLTAAGGFALLGGGLLLGASTSLGSSDLFVAAWMTLVGAGMGLALATTSTAALSELPQERSGVGSAALQAVNKVGGQFGSAVLGSVLAAVYQAHLNSTGLPAAALGPARDSVFGAVRVARQLGSSSLLASARGAFVDGMDAALVVSAGISVVGLVLALLFLPARSAILTPDASQEGAAYAETG